LVFDIFRFGLGATRKDDQKRKLWVIWKKFYFPKDLKRSAILDGCRKSFPLRPNSLISDEIFDRHRDFPGSAADFYSSSKSVLAEILIKTAIFVKKIIRNVGQNIHIKLHIKEI